MSTHPAWLAGFGLLSGIIALDAPLVALAVAVAGFTAWGMVARTDSIEGRTGDYRRGAE